MEKKKKAVSCYVTEDFSVVNGIKCVIQQFPDREEVYGIQRVDKVGEDGKKIVRKAFRVPTYRFILSRYWYFVLALIAVGTLCIVTMPLAMFLSLGIFGAFFFLYKPFSSEHRTRQSNKFFSVAAIAVALTVFYLLFFTDNYQFALKLSQGLFYGLLIDYTLLFFIGLFFKYGKIFAVDIDDAEDWRVAPTYIWTSKKQ